MRAPDPTLTTRLSRLAPEILLEGEDRLREILTRYPGTFTECNAYMMGAHFGVDRHRALAIYRELNQTP